MRNGDEPMAQTILIPQQKAGKGFSAIKATYPHKLRSMDFWLVPYEVWGVNPWLKLMGHIISENRLFQDYQ